MLLNGVLSGYPHVLFQLEMFRFPNQTSVTSSRAKTEWMHMGSGVLVHLGTRGHAIRFIAILVTSEDNSE